MQVSICRVDARNEENAHLSGEFTITAPAGDMPRLSIALVSLGEGLQWIGLHQRGAGVASYVRRQRLSDLVEIEPPLELEELAQAIPGRFETHLGWGSLPPRTSEEVLRAIEELRPGLASHIQRLRNFEVPRDLAGNGYEVAAMEKDALGLALNFQGLDRTPLQRWAPGEEAEGFLRGLEEVTLREDQILNHDLRVFGDWEIVEESAVGAVHYERGESSLTVVNVNRTPVEEALGVDLLYHHERFQAFVLVQYKRMGGARNDPVYRPDANLEQELELMRQVTPEPPDPVDQYSYRIGPGVCYLKLCRSVVLDPSSKDLIEGMYLPLEYFDACAPTALGPKGGRAYGYGTVPRHLNNTQFTGLVQDGWVGSSGVLTDSVRQVVEELVRRGDSVLLAAGTGRRSRFARS